VSSPTLLAQRKAALRAELRARRAGIAARSGESAAQAIAGRFPGGLPLPAKAVVAGYWPLEDELDPRPLMHRLAALGHDLALPRMQGRGLPLAFHRWSPGEPLVPGPFKVQEPPASAPHVLPHLVLAPLLAFDRKGRRLGYGAAFYDMTLRALRTELPEMLAIGLAFAAQEVDEVPADASDEALDGVLTDAGFHRCSARLADAGTGAR